MSSTLWVVHRMKKMITTGSVRQGIILLLMKCGQSISEVHKTSKITEVVIIGRLLRCSQDWVISITINIWSKQTCDTMAVPVLHLIKDGASSRVYPLGGDYHRMIS